MAENAGKEPELKLDKGGGKSKLIIIVVLVLLLAGGGGAFFMLKGGNPEEGAGGEGAPKELPESKKIFYVPVQSPFVFVATARPRGHVVQIKLSLTVRGPENQALATHHLPSIEGAITKAVGEISYEQLSKGSGKDDLKRIILKTVQARLNELESKTIVEDVLYDGFIIQ